MKILSLFAAIILAACGQTGQNEVSYPILAAGIADATVAVGDWTIVLTRADVGIGPIYFCAASGASLDLCPHAVQEFTHDALIDGLDPTPQSLGQVTGVSGSLRSTKYDLGISWPLTSSNVVPSASAPEGHSVFLAGRATRGTDSFEFTAEIDIEPSYQGAYAILGQRVDVAVADSNARLLVRVAPDQWLARLNFDSLFAMGASPVRIADGYAALEDGSVDPRQAARNALVLAITNTQKPDFEWTTGE
ncbi:MAG: hypothetical protein IPK60_21910 [Sandaracinaceae bacterium]|nr:hypothetical protein [Sandaracinaceae bacterium]